MISLLFLSKLTFVLLLGAAGSPILRKTSPASRHLFCIGTLGMAALLPLTLYLPAFAPPYLVIFVANASRDVAGQHASSVHWLWLCWIAGSLCVLLRSIAGMTYLAWQARNSTATDGFESNGVAVRMANITTPVLWGWLRPTILMPSESSGWTIERKRLAIAHELAHHDRRDNWAVLISIAAQAMYWFHPLVWRLAADAERQRELACDDRVLTRGASSSEYAGLLVDIARQHSSPVLFGCAMFRNKNHLKGRIMHILQFRKTEHSRRNRFAIASAISILLLGCTLIPAAVDQQKVYKIGGDVTAPKVLHKVEPSYAPEPKRDKIQGSVLLGLIITADGQPQDIHVIRSLNLDLDRNAVEAVSQWEFQPATKNGVAVPVQANIEVNFRLL